jgi:precorrin-6A/cobalt-precorrin-6A reductase
MQDRPTRLLVLGGSTEASELVRQLPPRATTLSLAGRTTTPGPVPDGVARRVGGFGGVPGLVAYLRAESIPAVVDGTHPFAAHMPFHAAAACDACAVPRLRLLRPPWSPRSGDDWTMVASMDEAAAAVAARPSARAFLAIGRQELVAFEGCDPSRLVVRSIEPRPQGVLDGADAILDRGPFAFEAELALLQERRIDLLVTKNAGGEATRSKLEAARQLGIPVVVVARPPSPPGPTVATVAEAAAWAVAQLAAVADETAGAVT